MVPILVIRLFTKIADQILRKPSQLVLKNFSELLLSLFQSPMCLLAVTLQVRPFLKSQKSFARLDQVLVILILLLSHRPVQ